MRAGCCAPDHAPRGRATATRVAQVPIRDVPTDAPWFSGVATGLVVLVNVNGCGERSCSPDMTPIEDPTEAELCAMMHDTYAERYLRLGRKRRKGFRARTERAPNGVKLGVHEALNLVIRRPRPSVAHRRCRTTATTTEVSLDLPVRSLYPHARCHRGRAQGLAKHIQRTPDLHPGTLPRDVRFAAQPPSPVGIGSPPSFGTR